MKKILLLLLLLCSMSASAQDVIVKRDGTAVVCRIINVSSLEIVYKNWADLQGPNLVMSVADAVSITYENGDKKVFDNATVTQTSPIVQNNNGQQTVSDDVLLKMAGKPELTPEQKLKKAKKLKKAGWTTGGVLFLGGIGAIVGSLPTYFDSKNNDYLGMGFGIGAPLIGVGAVITTACVVRANNLKKQASKYSVQSASIFQQEFHFKNGTTLSSSIDIVKDNTRNNSTLGVGLTYNF